MKVFPISMYRMKTAPGLNMSATPQVQANVDANEGLKPHSFGTARGLGKVAVVGYGPSLQRTWEQLRDYDVIWTTSGAHDFLQEKGIAPRLHTDIDFRKHKLDMVTPREGTRYVMGNTIHPEFAHKLKRYDLSFFQPIGEKSEQWFRLSEHYPRVKIDGDVAMATIALAAKEGFNEIDVFGVDCSYDVEYGSHAGPHGGAHQEPIFVTDSEYNLYQTTNNLLVGCATFVKVVRSLPVDVSVTVVSDGLLPAWIDMVEGQDG